MTITNENPELLSRLSISPTQKNTLELFSMQPVAASASACFTGDLKREETEQRLQKIVEQSSALNECFIKQDGSENSLTLGIAETSFIWLDWSTYEEKDVVTQKAAIHAGNRGTFDISHPSVTVWCAELSSNRYWLRVSTSPISVDAFSCFYILGLLSMPSKDFNRLALGEVENSEVSEWLNEFAVLAETAATRKYWREAFSNNFYDRNFRLLFAEARTTEHIKTSKLALAEDCFINLAPDDLGDTVFAILKRAISSFGDKNKIGRIFSSRADSDLSEFIGPLSRAVALDTATHKENFSSQVDAEKDSREMALETLESFFKSGRDRKCSFSFTYEVLDLSSSSIQFDDLHLRYENSLLAFTLVVDGFQRCLHIQYDENKICLEPFTRKFLEIAKQKTTTFYPENAIQGNVRADDYISVVDWMNDTAKNAVHSCIEYSSGNQMQFDMLYYKANQFARFLRENSIEKGDVVAVALPRSIDFLITVFGTSIAGAAYLPLELDMPIRRLSTIVNVATPKIVISNRERASEIAGTCYIFSEIELSRYDSEPLQAQIEPDDLAYLIFTSGSTGVPKGVEITHRALINHMQWMQQSYPFDSEDVVLHRTSVGFDASVWEYWSALLNDTTLLVTPNTLNQDIEKMAKALNEHEVSVMQCVPSFLSVLLENDEVNADFLDLRYLFCGGEALKMNLARRANKILDCKIINLYGPTECCIDSSSWEYKAGYELEYAPIGRPIDNLEFIVVGEQGESLGIGELGELCISGNSVFRGYFNDREATNNAIFGDGNTDKRYYRTGDRVYLLADGLFYFVGRSDTQLKVNGFRIEAAEVEGAAREMAVIKDAICLTEKKNGQLVLGLESDSEVQVDQVKEHLSKILAGYMVPNLIVVSKSFPLMANGKIDRKQILAQSQKTQQRVYFSPESPEQEAVADLWKEILDVDFKVGIDDDFFSLGGDSISLIRFVFEASKQGISLSVLDVLDSPSIRALDSKNLLTADRLSLASNQDVKNVDFEGLDSTKGSEKRFPVTGMQQFMLAQAENDQSSLGIFQPQQVLYLDGLDISADELTKNLSLLFEYPNFRLRFIENEGELSQFVDDSTIPISILNEDNCEIAEASLAEYVLQDRKNKIQWRDVTQPLLRATLFNVNNKPYCLVLSNIHVIQDGWGNIEFINKLISLMQGSDPALILENKPEAEKTLREFAHQDAIVGEDALAHDFWRDTLPAFDAGSWQYYHPPTGFVNSEYFSLAPAAVERLQVVASRIKVVLKDLLVSACLLALESELGVEHASFGIVSNGRNEHLSDPLGAMGLFWNFVPVTGVEKSSISSQAVYVNQFLSKVEAHKRYPISNIVEMNDGRLPFRYTFNFVKFHKLGKVQSSLSELRGNKPSRKGAERGYDYFGFPIEFVFSSEVDGLHGSLQFQTEVFSVSAIKDLIKSILKELDALQAVVARNSGELQ